MIHIPTLALTGIAHTHTLSLLVIFFLATTEIASTFNKNLLRYLYKKGVFKVMLFVNSLLRSLFVCAVCICVDQHLSKTEYGHFLV